MNKKELNKSANKGGKLRVRLYHENQWRIQMSLLCEAIIEKSALSCSNCDNQLVFFEKDEENQVKRGRSWKKWRVLALILVVAIGGLIAWLIEVQRETERCLGRAHRAAEKWEQQQLAYEQEMKALDEQTYKNHANGNVSARASH